MTSELRPAVDVWEDAYRAWDDAPINPDRIGKVNGEGYSFVDEDRAAAAVIQAYGDEREAKGRAEQAAEIERLKSAWEAQHKEKVAERAEAKLWFMQAQKAMTELDKYKALAETLAGALEKIATSKYDGLEVHRVSARQCHRIAAEALRQYKEATNV